MLGLWVWEKNFDQKTSHPRLASFFSPGNENIWPMLAMGLPAKSGPWAERKEPLSAKAAKVWWSWCSIPQLVAFAVLPCLFAGFSYAARERVAAPPCKQDSQSPPVAPFDNAAALMLEATCEYTCRPFASLERPWAVHYANNTAYEVYDGEALLPDGAMRLPFMSPFRISSKSDDGELEVCECTAESSRGTWHTQRVGPIQSTGGNDWWQFSWDNFANLRAELEASGTMEVTGHIITPVDAAGNIIPHPPIHIHHVHVVAGSASFASSIAEMTAKVGGGNSFFEHHGDWQFPAAEGGVESLGEDYGSHGKLFVKPFSTNLELNDMRPSGSPPMTWYFQMSLRVRPVRSDSCSPTSLHVFSGPGPLCMEGQGCTVTTVQVPAAQETFSYYTSRMPHAGHLVRMKYHGHSYIFRGALLFRATPAQLGLEGVAPKGTRDLTAFPMVPLQMLHTLLFGAAPRNPALANVGWRGTRPWASIPTEQFGGNAELKLRLLRMARENAGNDSIVCDVEAREEESAGVAVDRAPKVACSPWRFREGEQVTGVSFFGPSPMRPPAPSEIARFTHHVFWIYYAASDGTTHDNTYRLAGPEDLGDNTPAGFHLFDFRFLTWSASMVRLGGVPSEPPWLVDYATAPFIFLMFASTEAPWFVAVVFLLLILSFSKTASSKLVEAMRFLLCKSSSSMGQHELT